MAPEWFSLVSQKLFLAEQLIDRCEHTAQPLQEAQLQGSIELIARARQTLLSLVAQLYQHRQVQPENLPELLAWLEPAVPEYHELTELSQALDGWWLQLDALIQHQQRPPQKKKQVSDENIIAISVQTGPDRTKSALLAIISAMKSYVKTLEARHAEW
ncbi:MAG: hypothetical protein LAT63_00490 [Marinobacter sp.]|nr:hypothetical protein [Marinobacter sp.]